MTEDPNIEDSEAIEWLTIGVQEDEMQNLLLSFAEAVHLSTPPYAWFLQKIVAKAPNLKLLRIIPAYADMVEPGREGGKLLAERSIEVVIGRARERGEEKKDLIVTSYLDKRYFMLRLDEERKKLLAEVEKYAPEYWGVTSRYLCLQGEKHLPLGELAEVFDVSMAYITVAVGAVLYYLDSPFDASLQSVDRARVLTERVEKGREADTQAELRREKLRSLGLVETDMPEGMSLGFIEQYALVLKGWHHDRLSEYLVGPRERLVLVRRYGLEDKKFRPLEEVGQELGVTRERIRQIESGALKKLNGWKITLPSS